MRTGRELASFAHAHRDDVTFVVFDLEERVFRAVRPEWIEPILHEGAKIDTSHFADPLSDRKRLRERLPRPLKALALWIQRPRRKLFVALERRRLTAGSDARAERIRRLQKTVMSEKYGRELTAPEGGLRTLIPYDMAVGPALTLTSDDVLVFAGSDWHTLHLERLEAAGHERPKIVTLCYDIIPLLFPQFYPEKTVRGFRAHYHRLLPLSDLVIFNAHRVEADTRKYCESHGLTLGRAQVVPLGADVSRARAVVPGPLPDTLTPGSYALFVSTIEPRKGHRLLFSVWKRLLAAGIPQAKGFKLVFVGRRGWLVDDLLKELETDPAVGDTLFWFSNAPDSLLTTLYSNAAFCLYPSLYEGYGLPVIEGFRYGKAVLASTGGALAEVVGGISPSLDPKDEDAWADMIKYWIEYPGAKVPFEAAIREGFRPVTWAEAAQQFFERIDQELPRQAQEPS